MTNRLFQRVAVILLILLILIAIVVFKDTGRYAQTSRGGVLDTRTGETWWPGDNKTTPKPPSETASGIDFTGTDLD